ncbi:MAG: 4Fe-4S binding protein [Clostridia bacterium]|nr:4Fe-4S binding protein [Clostridia bacterium]
MAEARPDHSPAGRCRDDRGRRPERQHAGRPSTRRLPQLYAALLYNANPKGFIRGELYTGQTKNLCVPGLNCYSCPGAVVACPLGALQNALGVSNHKAGWYIFGILLLYGVTLGRTVCGWLCPFGLVQDLLHTIGGGASHPRTVVLNRRGEVTYNEPGSISADKLAGLFTDADLSSGGKEND